MAWPAVARRVDGRQHEVDIPANKGHVRGDEEEALRGYLPRSFPEGRRSARSGVADHRHLGAKQGGYALIFLARHHNHAQPCRARHCQLWSQ